MPPAPDVPTVFIGFPVHPGGTLAPPSRRITGASILTTTDVSTLLLSSLWGTSYEENEEVEQAVYNILIVIQMKKKSRLPIRMNTK